jgi:two-component system response regulator FixJ
MGPGVRVRTRVCGLIISVDADNRLLMLINKNSGESATTNDWSDSTEQKCGVEKMALLHLSAAIVSAPPDRDLSHGGRSHNSPGIMTTGSKIFVVADDSALQTATATACAEFGFVFEAFRSAEDFLPAFDPGAGRCLVIDLQLPGMSGLDLQRQLRDASHRLPVVVVCTRGDVATAVEAMRLGAHCVVEKPCSPDHLRREVEQAISDHEASLRREVIQADALRRLAKLTVKERDVVDLILGGMTNKAMAAELCLSLRGVEDRRARVMKKLQVESVAHLISLVRQAERWMFKK